jgi:hypothetical protein
MKFGRELILRNVVRSCAFTLYIYIYIYIYIYVKPSCSTAVAVSSLQIFRFFYPAIRLINFLPSLPPLFLGSICFSVYPLSVFPAVSSPELSWTICPCPFASLVQTKSFASFQYLRLLKIEENNSEVFRMKLHEDWHSK